MTTLSFVHLLYRYWFYGWLFRDVNRGSVLERAAARRHNQSCSYWLPTYMRRWACLGVIGWSLGCVLEPVAPSPVVLLCFVLCVLSVPINAVTLATWIGLRVYRF